MQQRLYRFNEATPFLSFIDQHRDSIVGHTLKAVLYSGALPSDDAVYFVLDNIALGVEYLSPSIIRILVAEETDFEYRYVRGWDDQEIGAKFHSRMAGWKDQCLIRSDRWVLQKRIVGLSIGRFSHEYADSVNTSRPDGGDYFSWIKLSFDDGTELYLEAQDGEADGYVDLVIYNSPAYETRIVPYPSWDSRHWQSDN